MENMPARDTKTILPIPKKSLKPVFFIIPVLLIVLTGAAVFLFFYLSSKRPEEEISVENRQNALTENAGGLSGATPRFASFKDEKTQVTPRIPSYTVSAANLVNLKALENSSGNKLSKNQLDALVNPGFYITGAPNYFAEGDEEIDFRHGGYVDEFIRLYKDISGETAPEKRKPENAVFITSDLLLHVFHVFIDRTFQSIEETVFQPKLTTLTAMLFEKSLEEYGKASEGKIKESFGRLGVFFLVPKVVLEASIPVKDLETENIYPREKEKKTVTADDNNIDSPENILKKLDGYKDKVPEKIFTLAKEELELINEARDASLSPLFGPLKENQLDDYTQFKPRSHYTKNSALRSYWKAMIWYGRNAFVTKSDDLTRDGILQSHLLAGTSDGNTKAQTLWENIYLPTVFFVGKTDDLSVYDYSTLIEKVYGKITDFNVLNDDSLLKQFKDEVKKLPGPKIQSSIVLVETDKTTKEEALETTKSFRFMGQRFIPDSFILSSLTQGDEAPDKETGQKLPEIPTALMPLSVFGSDRAEYHLDTWIKDHAADSDKVIAKEKKKLETEFAKLDISDWTQNLYWSWLYTLKSLFQKFGEGYPGFMQSAAWRDKDLNTSLGSYTELRHDTLLYAKQSYAELGAGGLDAPTPPPVPKGYVEPNIEFLDRIIALAKMTGEGFEKNNILSEEQKNKLDQIIETYSFYRDIAVKELENTAITDEEFEKLRTSPLLLNFPLTPADFSLAYMKASDARAGLIADIHTAVTTRVQEILYEATGIPNIIYTAVSDTNGTRIVRGVTYSYYEFTRPFGERLSDQDWQASVYEGKSDFPAPEKPDWAKSLEK